MRSKYLAATLIALAASTGAAMAGNAPAEATSCEGNSYHPTGNAGWVTGTGIVDCTSPIYQIHPVIELQKRYPDGWVTLTREPTDCYNTSGCGRGAAASNPGRGEYRTKTGGWVRATRTADSFNVTPRYSASFTV